MARIITLWITSHLVQLALVAALCSGVEVPNTSPRIFSSVGAGVMRLTTTTTRQHTMSITPQKYSQLKSKNTVLNQLSDASVTLL